MASGFPSEDVPARAWAAEAAPRPPRPCIVDAVSCVEGLGQSAMPGVQIVRVLLTGSINIVWVDPSASSVRYQKRSSGIQFAATLPPTTRPVTAGARNDSA